MTMIMANPIKPRRKVNPQNDQSSFSVFHADPTFVKKIQSRDSCSGDGLSIAPESFRAPARVPFQWESRPGEPINPPEKIESPSPATESDADSPASSSPPTTPRAVGPVSSRARVCRFLKKLVDNGGKWGGNNYRDELYQSSPTSSSSSSRGSVNMKSFSWGCIKSGF